MFSPHDTCELSWCRQSTITRVQCGDTDLVEQSSAVERVPLSVCDESRRSPLRERAESERTPQLDEIARTETAQADTSGACVTAHEPRPTGIDQLADASRDNRQNLVGAKSSQRKEHSTR